MKLIKGIIALSTALACIGAYASPVVSDDTIPHGISTFNSIVTGTGTTVGTAAITAGTYSYTVGGNTVTISKSAAAGGNPVDDGRYSSGVGGMTADSFVINPAASSGDPIPGFQSGLKFTFSTPVNAFGFEIGDWATCCTTNVRPVNIQTTYHVPATGSGLWIAFDGGSANLTANALSAADNPGEAAGFAFNNFIYAIDSSSTFSTITFFGDGFGEFLVAGGTLRFASVPINSVGNGVPEPMSVALLGIGVAGLALARRRRNS